tara:strand:+ start:1317 stop:1700 length:384 start_codon:yes stop_codon:yes gene_type:complete
MAISFDQYQQIIKESGPAFIKELKKLLGTQGLLLERQGKINATSYPKVRTGRLRSSITGAYNGRISNPEIVLRAGGYAGGAEVDYAGYVEYGTSRMSPRLYLNRSIEANHPKFMKALASLLARSFKR